MLETFVGTPVYMAPVISALSTILTYMCKSDCWSLGVVLYILHSGTQPLDAEAFKQKITKGQYQPMIGGRWEATLEEDAENLE